MPRLYLAFLLLPFSQPLFADIDCAQRFAARGSFVVSSSELAPLKMGVTYIVSGKAEMISKTEDTCLYQVSMPALTDPTDPEERHSLSDTMHIRLLQQCEHGRVVLAYENLALLNSSSSPFELVAMDYNLDSWNDYLTDGVVVAPSRSSVGVLNFVYAEIKYPRCR